MKLTTILLLSSSILLVGCSAEKADIERTDIEKAEVEPRPFLVLCFDVEDYTSPESAGMDDIPKWLAETMTDVGATGSFFVIGEKARSLEARGRRDVIEAMARHDVGSHTSLGSIHPTVTEILEHASFDAGVETMLAERGGGIRRPGADLRPAAGRPGEARRLLRPAARGGAVEAGCGLHLLSGQPARPQRRLVRQHPELPRGGGLRLLRRRLPRRRSLRSHARGPGREDPGGHPRPRRRGLLRQPPQQGAQHRVLGLQLLQGSQPGPGRVEDARAAPAGVDGDGAEELSPAGGVPAGPRRHRAHHLPGPGGEVRAPARDDRRRRGWPRSPRGSWRRARW